MNIRQPSEKGGIILQITAQAMAKTIAGLVAQEGGRTYYVGGYVRDGLLRQDNKDLDIEVHGITPQCLARILDGLGERVTMGESFGVFGLKGYSLDIAMPRKEEARGLGHRDFSILVDPFIGTRAAALRRDFTVNAMMQDVLTGQILDHFGGISDLEAGILRHVNDQSFAEDPLRVLRGAQFAARFGFRIAEETLELFRRMPLTHLPRERIEGELKKALLKGEKPSVFFQVLRRAGQLEHWFPELQALIGVPQNPVYHAEGDVWNHTMLVLDQAAGLRCRTDHPYWFMLSAVCHDFGKALCTREENGVLHAYRHETLGLAPAEAFLRRLTAESRCICYVLNMVEYHMKPNTAAGAKASVKSTNRLFYQSVDPEGLVLLALADDRGRITQAPACDHEAFLYQRLESFRTLMEQPRVMGKDLMEAGLSPGAHFSQLLEHAMKLHLAGIPRDTALRQTLAYARTLSKKNKGKQS